MDDEKLNDSTPHKRSKSVPGMSPVGTVLNDTQLQAQAFIGRSRSNTADSVDRLVRTQRTGARLSSGGLLRSQSKKRRNNGLNKSRSVDVIDLDESSKSSRKSSNSSQSSEVNDEDEAVNIRARKQGFCLPSVDSVVEKLRNMESDEKFPNNVESEQTNSLLVCSAAEESLVGDRQLKSTVLLQDEFESSTLYADEEQHDNSYTSHRTDDVQQGENVLQEQMYKFKKESKTNIRRRSLPADLSKCQLDSNLEDYNEGHEYRARLTRTNQTDIIFQNKHRNIYKNRCQNKWRRWDSMPESLCKASEVYGSEGIDHVTSWTRAATTFDDQQTSVLQDPFDQELSDMQDSPQNRENGNSTNDSCNENQTGDNTMADESIDQHVTHLSNNEDNSNTNNEFDTKCRRSGLFKRSFSLPVKFAIVDEDERQEMEKMEFKRTKSLSTPGLLDEIDGVFSVMLPGSSVKPDHEQGKEAFKDEATDKEACGIVQEKPKRSKKRKKRRRAKSLPGTLALAEIPEESTEEYDYNQRQESLEDMAKKHVNKAFQELLRKIRTSQGPRHIKVKRSRSLSTIKEIAVLNETVNEDRIMGPRHDEDVTLDKTHEQYATAEEEHEQHATAEEEHEQHAIELTTTEEGHQPEHEQHAVELTTTEVEHEPEHVKKGNTSYEQQELHEKNAIEETNTEELEEHEEPIRGNTPAYEQHAGVVMLPENTHEKNDEECIQQVREELQEEHKNNTNEQVNFQQLIEEDSATNGKEFEAKDQEEYEELQKKHEQPQLGEEVHEKNEEQVKTYTEHEGLYGKQPQQGTQQGTVMYQSMHEQVNEERSSMQKAREELHIEIPQILVNEVVFEQCKLSAVESNDHDENDEFDACDAEQDVSDAHDIVHSQTEELRSPDEEDIQSSILEHIHNMDFTFDSNPNQRSKFNVVPCMERIPEDPDKETVWDSAQASAEPQSSLKRAGSMRRGRATHGKASSSSRKKSWPQANNTKSDQLNRDQKRVTWSDSYGITETEDDEVTYPDRENGFQEDQYEPGPSGDITFTGLYDHHTFSGNSEENVSQGDFVDGPRGDICFTESVDGYNFLDSSDQYESSSYNPQPGEYDNDPMESKFDSLLRNAINSYLEPDYSQSESPIHQAVAQGSIDYLSELIENGADVNLRDEHGWPPLHVATLFNNVDCAALLLDAGADLQGYTDLLIHEYHTLSERVC